MTKPLITLPCTARELENALHAVCDHGGLWDAKICFGIREVEPYRTGVKAIPTLCIETETEHTPRPATEDEVDAGKAQWCAACKVDCHNAGRDLLVVCDKFKTDNIKHKGEMK